MLKVLTGVKNMTRKKSISTHIFIGVFSLFFLILGTFSIMISNIYGNKMEEMEINYHLETTNSTIEQFNMLISMINEYSYTLVSDPYIQEALHADLSNRNQKQIKAYIDVMKSMNYSINQIHILGANGFWCSSNQQSTPQLSQEYLEKYLDGKDREEIWTNFHTEEENDYLSSTSYIRPVFDSETKQVYGVIVIDVSYETIHKLFTASSIRLHDKAVIVNSAGEIILQYPLSADYTEVLRKYPQAINSKDQIEGKLYKKDVIIVSEKINMGDWKLIRFVQKDAATESFRNMINGLKVFLAVITIISVLYTIWLTRFITKPIKELMKVCAQVMEGDFTAHATVESQDEFGRLGKAFNKMIHQINEFFDNERRNQKRKAEMEYQILQAQINPHFLYNTLDSMKWLAVMQGMDNIAEMSTALINLLKYNLGKVEGDTTLKNEVDSVSNYIVLQKYRYSDTFEFTTAIEENLEHCRVLRFILQPLVENSIIHGFSGEGGNYSIHIEALNIEGKLHIRVIDNGSGIDTTRIDELNRGTPKSTKFSNIGVTNIRERIKLHFGEAAELTFDSVPNVKTVAEIILPLMGGEGIERSK